MSEFAKKKVLITGGMGFIGSNLARRLVKLGSQVTVVDSLIPQYGGNEFNLLDVKDKLTCNISDVRDPHALAHLVQDQDYLFNLAGQTSHLDSMHDPQTDLEINVSAQLSILEACRKHNPAVKIVFASTRQFYGRPRYLPVDEKHPIAPVDVNGINKFAGEYYHLLYNQVYGIRSTALRLTNTYGPRMRVKDARQTFLGIWIKNLIQQRPIQVFGDGLQLRDFNYVDDVVEAFLLAAASEKTNGQVFNLGSADYINLKNLAERLVALSDSGKYEVIPFPEDRKAIDIGDYYSDFSLFQKTVGWTPKQDLLSGLALTVKYYIEHGHHYW